MSLFYITQNKLYTTMFMLRADNKLKIIIWLSTQMISY